jgi:hypothetical protein
LVTTFEPTAGIYVIEVSHGVVKVGLSADTDRRIATHLRNARGLGADPYRWHVIPCPADVLREAERAAHTAVRAAGGSAQARTPEVFTGVYYTPALAAAQAAVEQVVARAAALSRLRALSPAELDRELRYCSADVAVVVRHLVAEAATVDGKATVTR